MNLNPRIRALAVSSDLHEEVTAPTIRISDLAWPSLRTASLALATEVHVMPTGKGPAPLKGNGAVLRVNSGEHFFS